MSWIYYLLEANLYLTVFYGLYYVLLQRETFYQANRAYLLGTSLLAFVIPLVQLDFLKPVEIMQVSFNTRYNFQPVYTKAQYNAPVYHIDFAGALLLIYIGIALFLLANFFIKVYRLIQLSKRNLNSNTGNYHIVETCGEREAFSFFNYLFISPQLAAKQTVIDHELIHIRQKHSWDIVYTELLKIISWFNPAVYLLQYRFKELHEFIADRAIVGGDQNPSAYTDFLVNNAYGIGDSSLVNTFFNKSLLKQRIIMLHQKRSGRSARLKYLASLPVITGLLCISTLAFSKSYGWINISKAKKAVAAVHNRTLINILNEKRSTEKSADTNRIAPPPPPPRAPRVTNIRLTAPKNPSLVTKKGYKYAESGYLINGKTDFQVVIVEKNGVRNTYFKSVATPEQLKMLNDKYGYTFPTMSIYNKIPPPPPAPPADMSGIDRRPPPPPPANPADKRSINKRPPPPPPLPGDADGIKNLPPPMAPYKPLSNTYAALGNYLTKTVRYPTAAMNKKTIGSVIVSFSVDGSNGIDNIIVEKGIGDGCDEEVVRALKSYKPALKTNPGSYKIAVTYLLDGLTAPNPASADLAGDPQFMGEATVTGYPNK